MILGLMAALTMAAAAPNDRCVEVRGRKVCLEGPAERGLPLVLYLHGYGSEGADDSLGLRALAEGQRFLYAAPDAPMNQHGQREWRPSEVAFFHELLPRLMAVGGADPKRVYVAGFSLGGFRALDLACLHPEGIAAVVSVSGTRLEPAAKCAPGAVSTLHVHGEADATIVPSGGIGRRTGIPYLSVRAAAALAIEAAACKTALAAAPGMPGVRVERATGCRGGATVEVWMVPGMGHSPRVPPLARGISSRRTAERQEARLGRPESDPVALPRGRPPSAGASSLSQRPERRLDCLAADSPFGERG